MNADDMSDYSVSNYLLNFPRFDIQMEDLVWDDQFSNIVKNPLIRIFEMYKVIEFHP